MMRIKESALEVIDGEYFLNDRKYTGVVYLIVDELICDVFNVNDGVRYNKCDDFFDFNKYDLSIDVSRHDDLDDEPFMYKGYPFTGVAYEFDDNICVGAQCFEDGYKITNIGWFESGAIGFYESFHEGFSEFSTWLVDGKMSSYKLFIDYFRLEVDFDESEKIKRLSVFGGNYNTIIKYANRLKFFIFEDFKGLFFSSHLYLSGDGIDGVIFELILSAILDSEIKKINISKINLNEKDLIKIKEHGIIILND